MVRVPGFGLVYGVGDDEVRHPGLRLSRHLVFEAGKGAEQGRLTWLWLGTDSPLYQLQLHSPSSILSCQSQGAFLENIIKSLVDTVILVPHLTPFNSIQPRFDSLPSAPYLSRLVLAPTFEMFDCYVQVVWAPRS